MCHGWLSCVGRSGKICVCLGTRKKKKKLTGISLSEEKLAFSRKHRPLDENKGRLRVSSNLPVKCKRMQFWVNGRNKGF